MRHVLWKYILNTVITSTSTRMLGTLICTVWQTFKTLCSNYASREIRYPESADFLRLYFIITVKSTFSHNLPTAIKKFPNFSLCWWMGVIAKHFPFITSSTVYSGKLFSSAQLLTIFMHSKKLSGVNSQHFSSLYIASQSLELI